MSEQCRIDKSDLIEIIDLGDQYVSDFVNNPEQGEKSSLKLCIGKTSGLVQLKDTFSPEKMYKKYWYRSSINESMVTQLKNIVDCCNKVIEVKKGDVVLDIACNDGTLLSFWDKSFFRIGIDPSDVAKTQVSSIDALVNDFFSSENYYKVSNKKAKVITSIAMFYDLEDPNWFVDEIKKCLDNDGIWVIQMSYMPLMLEQNAFDNICHEHLEYYSFTVLNNLLEKHGMKVFDVELNDTNSGSIRTYITFKENKNLKLSHHARQIGQFRVNSLIEYEKKLNLLNPKPYIEFFERIEKNKTKTLELLSSIKENNLKVIGYGASTKGNTLLQYYGIGPELISCIAERSKEKWGLKTVGTGIPIISEEEMRKMKPDYLFIFPWHFVDAFKKRESELINLGTKLIVPLPELYII